MPNFVPFKNYSLRMIDQFIEGYGLQGPFLDAGCGRGDVALHLAQRHSWSGKAVDFSDDALRVARVCLAPYDVQVEANDLLALTGRFRTILLLTVIEHLKDDLGVLRHLRTCIDTQGRDGHLIVSMPSNPDTEWRWDDDFYGHYRRYTRAGVARLLAEAGYEMLEYWDYTYPVFWAMRRAYTALLPAKRPIENTKEGNSAASAIQNAWDMGILSKVLSAAPVWPLVFTLQERFKTGDAGFEAMALAQAV